MIVGVTGSRTGTTGAQRYNFVGLVDEGEWSEFHHGDCVGADEYAHAVVKSRGIRIVVHPPSIDTYRAFCVGDSIVGAQDYMTRNRHIVESVGLLVAMPKTMDEVRRSGTWSTVRMARKRMLPVIVLFPDGSIVEERTGVEV